MGLLDGLYYNLRGLWFGLRSPKLLLLGLVRLAIVILMTIAAATLILVYQQEILNMIWSKPDNQWLIWLWHVLSWLLSLIMIGLSAVFAYLVSQILFCVVLMDLMSRITERMLAGQEKEPAKRPFLRNLFYLMAQEIPRAVFPILVSLLILILGWLTPLGPFLTAFSTASALIFLAWDNTDLIPARRLFPFKARLRLLSRSLLFHLGFGLPFLIPVLNILFLSFAPVGATMYFVEKQDRKESASLPKNHRF
jgi:CysZ protein